MHIFQLFSCILMLSSWEWMRRWDRKCFCKAINISSNILTLKWHFHFHHRHAVEQTNLLIALDHRWAYSIFMLTKCLYLVAYIFVSFRISKFALENHRTTTWCWNELDFAVWCDFACSTFALLLCFWFTISLSLFLKSKLKNCVQREIQLSLMPFENRVFWNVQMKSKTKALKKKSNGLRNAN